ncbi:MAG: 6-phosphogluconolactonase, partial [Candidatus Atribacteria bacterium]|nr:6-phosphogluconolactonase [Candidatus Atribacteria bacterium]
MKIKVSKTKQKMGRAAAEEAARILIDAIREKGEATFITATGASQFEFLENLTSISSIDWSKTTMFHLDEYIGFPETHPASFRKYLRERLINKVHPGNVYLIKGDAKSPES